MSFRLVVVAPGSGKRGRRQAACVEPVPRDGGMVASPGTGLTVLHRLRRPGSRRHCRGAADYRIGKTPQGPAAQAAARPDARRDGRCHRQGSDRHLIGLDTKVLVRYFVRDDPARTALADLLAQLRVVPHAGDQPARASLNPAARTGCPRLGRAAIPRVLWLLARRRPAPPGPHSPC